MTVWHGVKASWHPIATNILPGHLTSTVRASGGGMPLWSKTNSQMSSRSLKTAYKVFADSKRCQLAPISALNKGARMQDAQADQSSMPETAVWIGIDWADQKHAYAMQVADEERVGRGEIDHTPEAVEEFFTELCGRFPDQMVAVAMEQARGSLTCVLRKYGRFGCYPVR